LPNISAFGETSQGALEELKTAWELVKEDYKVQNRKIPVVSNREKIAN
jgi:predicted RNase H-like HicB family nuclease